MQTAATAGEGNTVEACGAGDGPYRQAAGKPAAPEPIHDDPIRVGNLIEVVAPRADVPWRKGERHIVLLVMTGDRLQGVAVSSGEFFWFDEIAKVPS